MKYKVASEWTEARKSFERKARDRKITKESCKYYEDFWAFYQAGINFVKQEAAK